MPSELPELMTSPTFSAATISTTTAAAFLLMAGLSPKLLEKARRYTHAIAGLTALTSGPMIEFPGL